MFLIALRERAKMTCDLVMEFSVWAIPFMRCRIRGVKKAVLSRIVTACQKKQSTLSTSAYSRENGRPSYCLTEDSNPMTSPLPHLISNQAGTNHGVRLQVDSILQDQAFADGCDSALQGPPFVSLEHTPVPLLQFLE